MNRIPTPKTIPFHGPIGLKKWYTEHKLPAGSTVQYKGKPVVISSQHYDFRVDDSLNELQKAYVRGDIDLYKPIECYEEQWNHDNKTQTWSPIPGTKKRNDLPPVYMQWKVGYGKIQRLSSNL